MGFFGWANSEANRRAEVGALGVENQLGKHAWPPPLKRKPMEVKFALGALLNKRERIESH